MDEAGGARPRLLFDENLAADLVRLLADEYPGSTHVLAVGLGGMTCKCGDTQRVKGICS